MRLSFFLILCTIYSCHPGKRYFSHINNAEQSIVKNDFARANMHYKKAFKYDKEFSDNNYNAYRVALTQKDKKFALYNAQKLIEKGLCIDFFNSVKEFKEDTIAWKKLVLSKKKQDKINYKYSHELDLLLFDDEAVGRENMSATKDQFEKNYEKFKMLLSEYGFPSESKVGITCTTNLKGYYSPAFYVLILHFMQSGFDGVEEILEKALANFEIDPYTYAGLLQHSKNKKHSCISPIFIVNDHTYLPKSCGDISSINTIRRKIGLPSVEKEVNLINFKLKNPENGFRLHSYIVILEGLSEDQLEKSFFKL